VDYPAACNASETLLLHSSLLKDNRGMTILSSLEAHEVNLFGGPRASIELSLQPAESLRKEYSALAITVEVVDGLDEGKLIFLFLVFFN